MFNPATASEKIKQEFIDYITTSFSLSDDKYARVFKEALEKNGIISKGPLIDIKDIFKSGHSINELIDSGILSPLFREIEKNKPNKSPYKIKLPLDRPLYVHQEKAIDVISTNNNNAVITTGTGSGKTECFLIPVLNELLRQKEAGTLDDGVRAILIYPMNALANDQMKRLREILMFYPDITFGVYNGDTKWEDDEAELLYNDLHFNEACPELRNHLPNELISRNAMNETPPHILCTNYAMLEHMLLRPENDAIFKNSDFRFVVLDEAHIYTGATGMETALLLRRLKARIKTRSITQYILTSATLGKESDSKDSILEFAKNLCGVKFYEADIVFGKRDVFEKTGEGKDVPAQMFVELAESDPDDYEEIFSKYGFEYDVNKKCEENIYDLCLNSLFYQTIRSRSQEPTDIEQFARMLNISKTEAVSFIHVCTLAYKGGKALIDAKYHFFIRALEGMYTTLIGDKQVFLDRKIKAITGNNEVAVFERAVCTNCGELGIVGKIEPPNLNGNNYLNLAAQHDFDTKFFHIITKDEPEFVEVDDEISDDQPDDEEDNKKTSKTKYKKYYLCPKCGKISEFDDGKPKCDCGVEYLLISEYENSNERCPKCQSGRYRRFYLGSEAATGVLATSLFEELPSKTITTVDEIDNIEYEYEGGKQFLSFSDSRSEAAFFASYMSKTYKEFLRRRAFVHALEENREDLLDEPISIDDFVDELTNVFVKNKTFITDLSSNPTKRELKKEGTRNAWIAILSELISSRRRSSLVSFGLLKFEYAGNTKAIVDPMSKKYGLDPNVCKELLDYLALTIAQFGAVTFDDDVLEAEDRKYIFFTDRQKTVIKQKTGDTSRYSMSWKARNREGKADSYYPNSRVNLVARILKSDTKKANEFLDDYFEKWLVKKGTNKYALELSGKGYVLPINAFVIRVSGDEEAKWYKCEKCGKVTTFNGDGICPEHNCGGNLTECNPKLDGNHFMELYKKKEFKPLLIKEHTAQLSRQEGLEYQKLFEKNKIHALSCSTTFEMGVDVGELETVFLRNVPPSAANYAQRAGRAGRSNNSAAYSLTYAKLSSHDFTYYKEPRKIIVGDVKPPKFKTDNEKIVLRHIFAVVLSYFFQNSEKDYFNNNNASIFLEEGGFEALKTMLKQMPEQLDDILHSSIPNVDKYEWQEKLIGKTGVLTAAIEEYEDTINSLIKAKEDFHLRDESEKETQIKKQISRFKKNEIIDFLVRNNILPKYGFPIDSVNLDVTTDDSKKTGLNLSRDLKLAISEYAPGEKVIADGKMYTSRYIKKSFFPHGMDYYTSYVSQCTNAGCETWNYSKINPETLKDNIKCVTCHKEISKSAWRNAIEPRGGFIAEYKAQDVPIRRPEKIYRSLDSYIGDGKNIKDYKYKVGDNEILLRSSENDEIMVTSNKKFYVCKVCGCAFGPHDTLYSGDDNRKIDQKATADLRANCVPYIKLKSAHRKANGHFCVGDTIFPHYLNHVYRTDVVIIDFCNNAITDIDTALSVLYAILNAMSEVMGIDIDDIGGTLSGSSISGFGRISYSLVIYDTVAGGAGHVGRIKSNPEVLEAVLKEAYNRVNTCSCDTSCYSCLRSYSNQRIHDRLNRINATNFLKDYLSQVKIVSDKEDDKVSIKLSGKGKSMSSVSYQDIFTDSIFDGVSEQLKTKLIKLFDDNSLPKPDRLDEDFSINGSEDFFADLVWEDRKIMLFGPDGQDGYEKAKNSDFNCFLIDDNINLKKLLSILS